MKNFGIQTSQETIVDLLDFVVVEIIAKLKFTSTQFVLALRTPFLSFKPEESILFCGDP